MDQQNGYYRQVRELTDSFLDEKLPSMIQEFIAEKNQPFLNLLTEMYSSVLKIKKDDPQRNKKIVRELNERIPKLYLLLQDEKLVTAEKWFQKIGDEVGELPETVEEKSSPDRFKALSEDSTAVRIRKIVKRVVRKLPGRKEDACQTIPLRNIIELVLLESPYIRKEIIGEGYLLMARTFDFILETEDDIPLEPNEKDAKNFTDDFRIDQISHVETHLQQAIQLLKKGIEPREDVMKALAKDAGNHAEKSDSAELSASIFEDETVNKKRLRYSIELKNYEEEWGKYIRSQFADFNIQLELGTYGISVSEVHKNILELTHTFFRDFCYLPLEGAVSYVKEIKQKLEDSCRGDVLSKKQTKEIQTEVRTDFADKILKNIRNTDLQEGMVLQIGKEVSRLQLNTSLFTESVALPKERYIENLVPYVAFDTIQWRALASRFFKENAVRELDPSKSELEHFIGDVEQEIEEALRIVDVNLTAALESVDVDETEESPLHIAMSGLDRAANLLEETIKKVRVKQNSYEEVVHDKLPASLHKLSGFMLSRSYGEFEMQDKAYQVKERAANWRNDLSDKGSAVADKFILAWRFLKKKTANFRTTAGRYLGFSEEESVTVQQKRSLSEDLSKAGADKDLPFVYRNIFKGDFSIDERFYVVPDQADRLYGDAFNAWHQFKPASSNVLIVGEKGSGKSTSVNYLFVKHAGDQPVVSISLDHTVYDVQKLLHILCGAFGLKTVHTAEEFIEKVKRRKSKKTVVQFENLQNLYIRNLHGFEALEAFWVILSSTSNELFWTVTISRYGWNFIKKISDADQYFTHIIDVDTLDKEKVKKAILARHRATGYDLHFVENTAVKKAKRFRKRETNPAKLQENQENVFFEKLSKLAEGNLSIAIMFWLQSIKKIEKNTFLISPIEITEVDKLEIPSREVLFTLASLVIHDRLTSSELAISLHQDEVQSRLMLMRLKSKGIVVEFENMFTLNHLVYRQVIRLLKRRNIIH